MNFYARLSPLFLFALLGHAQESAPVGPVTFAGEVAPILYRHCAECHHPDGDGPFSLLTYPEAKKRAKEISDVVGSGYMPPWKPAHGIGPAIKDARGLSPTEISALQRWVAADAPAGNLSDAPAAPSFTGGWKLGPPDLILTFPEAFEVPSAGKDVYHNFVVPIPLTARRYVRAVEFSPQSRLVIHHATMLLDPSGSARAMDAATPGLGFAGMEFGDAANPGGHFIGWSPGQVPYEAYPGTAWSVTPGTDFVLQLHLLPSGKPERISPKIGLYFTDEPPHRVTTVVQLSEQRIAIPAGEPAFVREQRFTLPVAAAVLGVYPHAHYLGKDLQLYADLPDGRRQWLLRIPDWDFNWQRDYRFAEPLALPAGARLVMHYVYDNSAANVRNPFHPPREVRGGWNSTDEMGEAAIQLLLNEPGDLAKMKTAEVLYAAESAGGMAAYSFYLGTLWQKRGLIDDAIRAYTLALQKNPNHAGAHQRLGSLAEDKGNLEAARQHYAAALDAEPAHAGHPLNLARALTALGRADEAGQTLSAGINQHPRDASMNLELGILCAKARDWARARDCLQVAATSSDRAMQADALRSLALVALATDDENSAVTHLTALLALPVEFQPGSEKLASRLPPPRGIVALARACVARGELKQAQAILDAAIIRAQTGGHPSWADAMAKARLELLGK